MEISSVCLECPDMGLLIDDLETRFDDYCYYEVFDYASGNVVVIAVQTHFLLASSNVIATVVLDFTGARRCRVDIFSGDQSIGLTDTSGHPRDKIHSDIVGFLKAIAAARGWRISDVAGV